MLHLPPPETVLADFPDPVTLLLGTNMSVVQNFLFLSGTRNWMIIIVAAALKLHNTASISHLEKLTLALCYG